MCVTSSAGSRESQGVVQVWDEEQTFPPVAGSDGQRLKNEKSEYELYVWNDDEHVNVDYYRRNLFLLHFFLGIFEAYLLFFYFIYFFIKNKIKIKCI